ncbi:DMT family transporter [Phaeobacter sp. NW0010-22]|uniref:DMT family transporter n=1 Tax=Phaeobacter sp. NW0010-22 TaxID=3135907 RepID=UPI003106C3D0
MRLFLLTALTMSAFAANSILNRLAVGAGFSDPGSFAVIRVLSGAVTLAVLVLIQRKSLPLFVPRRWIGAGTLSLYMVGFSMAYLTLDAGLGALILFGVVQMTMFGVSALSALPPARQWLGALVAFGGLAVVLWPTGTVQVDLTGALLMGLAGLGWGFYTLAGRSEPDALAGTGANFVLALPITAGAIWIIGPDFVTTPEGVGLAILSGAVTSGMGYALWYRVVPQLASSVAATVQLSVPIIALFAGVLMLGEAAGTRLLVGAILVVGGIALAVFKPRAI